MSFKSVYNLSISEQGLQPDPAQLLAVEQMSELFFDLSGPAHNNVGASNVFKRWLRLANQKQARQGCYLWGGVGRGKTWLMDMFYNAIPYGEKARFHYQHFMQLVHAQLSRYKGQQNPLVSVAKHLVKKAKLICIDEFHVLDITDAMLLYGLLDALYKMDAVLIMTSNLPPGDLYKNGLQRERFLPAIELIKGNNKIIECNGDWDYRLSEIVNSGNYLSPLGQETSKILQSKFYQMVSVEPEEHKVITINNRQIQTLYHSNEVVWFEFHDLCAGPRAASDYIEIAKSYPTVFLSGVYQMDESSDDVVRRFMHLIDELYDRGTQLVLSANHLPRYLYTGKRLEFEFERTISRLEEMRSLRP